MKELLDSFDTGSLTSDLLNNFLPKLAIAILVLIIGWWIIALLLKAFKKTSQKRGLDQSLTSFFTALLSAGLKILLVLTVLQLVGVEVTSFVAVLGAAGLAVGLALSGTLQNFAGGVLLIILKPFKAGDFIDALGYTGVVQETSIFNTILHTPDNKTVILPNGPLSTTSMVNFSTQPTRRVDMTFGIGYDDDIDKAKAILQKLIDADTRILKDPEAFIAVSELADSSVNFVVRAWCNAPDYWGIFFDMQEQVKKTFDAEGISIPYPQRDIHVHNQN